MLPRGAELNCQRFVHECYRIPYWNLKQRCRTYNYMWINNAANQLGFPINCRLCESLWLFLEYGVRFVPLLCSFCLPQSLWRFLRELFSTSLASVSQTAVSSQLNDLESNWSKLITCTVSNLLWLVPAREPTHAYKLRHLIGTMGIFQLTKKVYLLPKIPPPPKKKK